MLFDVFDGLFFIIVLGQKTRQKYNPYFADLLQRYKKKDNKRFAFVLRTKFCAILLLPLQHHRSTLVGTHALYNNVITQLLGQIVTNVLHVTIFLHELLQTLHVGGRGLDLLHQVFEMLLHIVHAEVE